MGATFKQFAVASYAVLPFYRLADRLKQRFPRLPICLLLDGLFAGGPTFTRCEQYGWKYLITLQDGDLPSVHQDFEALTRLAPENRIHFTPNSYPPVAQVFRWRNDLPYVDTEQRVHSLSVIDCLEAAPLNGQPHTTRFRWVSNFNVTAQKVIPLANQGGRLRWKIENEGFNVQKKRGLRAGTRLHSKPHRRQSLLLPLADRPSAQSTDGARSLFRQAFPKGVGSAKNLAFRLLEAWRNLRRVPAEVLAFVAGRFQIRFDTS